MHTSDYGQWKLLKNGIHNTYFAAHLHCWDAFRSFNLDKLFVDTHGWIHWVLGKLAEVEALVGNTYIARFIRLDVRKTTVYIYIYNKHINNGCLNFLEPSVLTKLDRDGLFHNKYISTNNVSALIQYVARLSRVLTIYLYSNVVRRRFGGTNRNEQPITYDCGGT